MSTANAPHLATLLFDSADLRIDMPKVHDMSSIFLRAMPPSLTPRPDAQLALDASLVSVVFVFVQIWDPGSGEINLRHCENAALCLRLLH